MTTAVRAGRQEPQLRALAALLGVALATACGPDVPKPKAATAAAETVVDDTLSGTADESQAALYVYSPVGKRDPFRDPNTIHTTAAQPQNVGPLQKFDLDQLHLTFTTTATSSPMALVVDPSGQGHIIQIGDFIGKNWGKVSAIKREEITVMEQIADPNTGRVYPDYIPVRMAQTAVEKQNEANYQLQWSPEAANQ